MKRILFTSVNTADLVEGDIPEIKDDEILVKTCYSAISAGTERDNITGNPNCGGPKGLKTVWPRQLGYSLSGIVEKVGSQIDDIQIGDKVVAYWGKHQEYNTYPRRNVVKIPEGVDMKDAAFAFISTFPLAAIRKTRMEIGESALVVGLGLLGLFTVQYAHIGGAYPVIAADFSEERRKLAIKLGADYALDPAAHDYQDRIHELTGGKGANITVEVTGVPEALEQALIGTARYGRLALLGCTREPTTLNLYNDVHYTGITMIGASYAAIPADESHPGWWTAQDDTKTALKLLAAQRLNIHDMISEIHNPEDCPEVYARLAAGKGFPIGVEWDWGVL